MLDYQKLTPGEDCTGAGFPSLGSTPSVTTPGSSPIPSLSVCLSPLDGRYPSSWTWTVSGSGV